MRTDVRETSAAAQDDGSLVDLFGRAVRAGRETVALATAMARGITDENRLTNLIFFARHPELGGRRLRRDERGLIREWLTIRDRLVRPARRTAPSRPGAPTPAGVPAPAGLRRTTWLRQAWQPYRCAESQMVPLRVFGRRTPVNPLTTDAFRRLEQVLLSTRYRATSAWNYNCRDIRGAPGQASLHAYGLAIDLDPDCNPRRPGARHPARFSSAPTQEGRCRDVLAGIADTSFTPTQIAAAESIRTVDGLPVFAWGGRWRSAPDAMHFQINASPGELRRGIAR